MTSLGSTVAAKAIDAFGAASRSPPKPVYKSATFWTTHGPAAPFIGWALLGSDGQPVTLRVAALVVGGLLVALYAILRTVNKAVHELCGVASKNPWAMAALLAGFGLRRFAASLGSGQASTSTSSPAMPSAASPSQAKQP